MFVWGENGGRVTFDLLVRLFFLRRFSDEDGCTTLKRGCCLLLQPSTCRSVLGETGFGWEGGESREGCSGGGEGGEDEGEKWMEEWPRR